MNNVHFARKYKIIPTQLTEIQFNQFVLPYLVAGAK